jgi:outer membrane protein assembly factor BamB
VQNLFRLRIEADEARQNQRLTFVDDGGPERESSLAVLVEWSNHAWKPVLEPVFDEFVREYNDAGSIVSPGSFLEKLVHALDAACNRVEPEMLPEVEFGVALCCGRGLYLLHSTGLETTCALDGGAPQPLVSSLRVRVKDLSPSAMRGSHLWNEALVERLRLVRVFFEDEDGATLRLAPRPVEEMAPDAEGFLVPATPGPRLVVDKEPGLEPARTHTFDSSWPDLGDAARRDRRSLSYAAVGLVGLLFCTALVGMWRWHQMGSDSRPPGAEALFAEPVDASLDARHATSRVGSEVLDGDGEPIQEPKNATKESTTAPGALSIVWSKRHSDWVTSSPRLTRGRVVYGCRDGHLYCVEPDGKVHWNYDSGAGIGATPAVEDGRVFCGNYAGRAFALRDKDGKELWSTDLASKLVASPSAGDKHVFFATQGGEIVALDKKNGREVWRHAAGGKLRTAPLAHDGDVFAAGGEGALICFAEKSGQVRWSYDAGSPVVSSPLLAEGRLVFGCKDGTVHAVAAKDGAPLWSMRTKGAVQATPGLGDGFVYIGSSDKRLYAVRLRSGDVAWSFPTKAAILASPCVQEGKVYVAAYDQHTYVLEAESGRELARLRLKAPIYSSPLVADGRIYCGSNDGTVYCMSDIRTSRN